ncbi:sigma-54 dependent transcriptional regulator [Aeoliella sp. ICT_H6.2]|uniref:DNA-binding transcriptional regulator NtrC n=1 Tax=Aeoliella straminimaris TaxID=2954799 RepID=A0A9X2JDW6_9BACT|nr:sigma-54 dependent transcriptional regulator [Aeoliella straminimaris]MCO6042355.1 sigma-54 dependent transcriptional regulator [Aeoliella straminimaris]
MKKLLLVDDDRAVHVLVNRALENAGFDVHAVTTKQAALEAMETLRPDVVLLDIILPDCSGLEAFQQIRQRDSHLPVIFITGSGTSDTAIEAMKLGGFDYVHKPIDLDQLEALVERAVASRRLATVPVGMRDILEPEEKGDAFVGRCAAMQEVFKAIGRVAPQNIPVLIRGESGTGKELVARAVFQHGARADGPFLAVNCAALSETLLESELFGHEKGSFTGAHERRIGKFEQCSGGTIFLDEVGDMTPLVQSKVLRLLQEQKFERVGGNETISTDVRIISATNRDLEEMCEEGEFRSDLFYRLNGFTINLPTLNERGDDRVMLFQHFLALLNRELTREVEGIAPDALHLLMEYDWPGNVRELQSVLKQAMLQASGSVLMAVHLPDYISEALSERTSGPNAHGKAGDSERWSITSLIDQHLAKNPDNLYGDMLAWLETNLLSRVLQHTKGNQSEAARLLGITRGSLRNKIRSHNISISQVVSLNDEVDSADAPVEEEAEQDANEVATT